MSRACWCACALAAGGAWALLAEPLPGTATLEAPEELADEYLSGADRFMLAEAARLSELRQRRWQEAAGAGLAAWEAWAATNRVQLGRMLGVRDERVPFDAPEPVASLSRSAVLAENATHLLMEIRWPVVGGFCAEGLALEPKAKPVVRNVVRLPHAGVTPEQLVGLEAGGAEGRLFAAPEPGVRVVVPARVSRAKACFESAIKRPGKGQLPGRMVMPGREFVYRPAYVMGRHLIGYEIQTVLALVDGFRQERAEAPVRVEGWGDGGLLALYAAALDERISEAAVAGYFGPREELWREPIDRNVFGLLRAFGDAEIAALIAPRALAVIAAPGPAERVTREKGEGGAPGLLAGPEAGAAAREAERARALVRGVCPEGWLRLEPPAACEAPRFDRVERRPDAAARERRLIDGMNGFSQQLLAVSPEARRRFLAGLDASSPEAYDRSAEAYRAYYRDQVMGRIDVPAAPLNPRSRRVLTKPRYDGYEVVVDVAGDLKLCGWLLLPGGIAEGERRAVVVVQHGRGGTPRTVMDEADGGKATYHGIAARLAERGYVVFAPQNPYVFEERYRQLVRKANPLGLTLYSVILAQYERMFAWLRTLPQADAERVGFIGQSYGGKTAVRVPPVMPEFKVAVSTGDFNDGVTKMASTLYPFSFALWDEYEMFEFDLGGTFNYADLAGLMAPRPFMAQRGHGDTVGWDEFVGAEYARVRALYAQLKLPERTAIDWFDGGHEIDLEPALAFFARHLPPR